MFEAVVKEKDEIKINKGNRVQMSRRKKIVEERKI